MTLVPTATPGTDSRSSASAANADPTDAGWANLARAASELQGRPERRAVEVANDVPSLAQQSARRSLPLRARPPRDYVRVSDQVLIRSLLEAIDAVSPTLALGRVLVRARPDGVLEEDTLELLVQYGEVILDVADHVRRIVGRVLAEVLGVEVADVHVITHQQPPTSFNVRPSSHTSTSATSRSAAHG